LAAVHKDDDIARKTMKRIEKLAADSSRFVPAKLTSGTPVQFNEKTLGIRTRYRDKKVLAIRDVSLDDLSGSRQIAHMLISQLQKKNILLGGHGHARTTQLPIPIRVGGSTIRKPRFWILDPERLREVAASPA
jgi:hypothetical protein